MISQKLRRLPYFLALLVLSVPAGPAAAQSTPTVTSISPSVGAIGAALPVSVVGTGFASAALSLERANVQASTWAATGSFAQGRFLGSITKLLDGRVLLAGGQLEGVAAGRAEADIYNPLTGIWTAAAPMNAGRNQYAASRLADGRVFVTGGHGPTGAVVASAEIYDPAANVWTTISSMSHVRQGHQSVLLPSGKVLVAGGYDGVVKLNTAELFDPATSTWTAAGPMGSPRSFPAMTLLANGKVLITGDGGSSAASTTAEIYDPGTNSWTATGSMSASRSEHMIALLPDGRVMAAGGRGVVHSSTTEIYDAVSGSWTPAGTLSAARYEHAMVLINGAPLVIGGQNDSIDFAGTDLYDAAANVWRAGPDLPQTRTYPLAVALDDGHILVAGGRNGMIGGTPLASAVLLSPPTAQISATGVSVVDAQHLTGTFNLTGAATGYWDVVVRESSGLAGRLPGAFRVYTSGAAFPGCAVTKNVGAGQTFATISAAMADLKANDNPLPGPSCVVIRDGATYAEQVTVRNFTNNGSSITILADPASGLTPVVSPPAASTAAFLIANASVSVHGINIAPANAMPFGVFISSAYVQLSSVNVQDAGGKIATAGVAASSWTTVSYASVTVGGANATGFWLPGSTMTSVSYSSAAANSSTAYAMRLTGASSNTLTNIYLVNLPGIGAQWLDSNYNSISRSSIACDNGTGIYAALYLSNSSSNTITRTYIRNSFVDAISVKSGSNYNTISQSTAVLTGAGGQAAIGFTGSSYNNVTGCFLTASGGLGVSLVTSHFNAISQSTITSAASGYSALYFVSGSATNTVTGSYIQASTAAYLAGSQGSVIDSSVLSGGPLGAGVFLDANNSGTIVLSSNTITGAKYGLLIATQSAGAGLAVSSMAFAGLASGATAVHFLGGAFVATFTAASFDASVAVNVNGALLNTASRVTMSAYSGTRTGPSYENDPGSLVDWVTVAAPSSFAAAALSASSILWTWADNSSDESGFRVMSGAVNLSGDLAAGATAWLQTGLSTNTGYGPFFSQAFNAGGTANSSTASRTTLAAAPPALAASDVYQTSATVSWSAGGNPTGTAFQLERSTGTGFGLLLAGAATYFFDGDLIPAVTHYYRVRALNGDGLATSYASSIAVVALPAPPVPGAAGTPAGSALGISSVSWTWALASGATSYFLYRASDGSALGSASSPPFVQTALTPNTAYGLRAAGVNLGGTGPLSSSATAYTLAAIPSGAGAVSIASTSLTASWGLNGNPGSTVAQLERSTNAVAYSTLAVAAVTSYADADLLGCTTYYYRVRNLNGDGLPTTYASFQGLTANTNPSPPAGLTASANAGGTVSLSWNLSPTEGVTGYRLYGDSGSGTVAYGAPIAVLGSTATAFTTGVLTSSASYTFALRALHRCGVEESTGALAMSGAAAALPAVRAVIKEPDSGKRIKGNRVTILGELIAGDAQQVFFQYKLAASTAWLDVPAANLNHSNPDFSFPYFTHWNVNALAAGSYDLRAVAYDRAGVPDPAPPAVRVVIVTVDHDIDENDDDGKIKKNQTISNTVASVIDTCGAGAADPSVRVTIPAGAVNAATATVSVTANPAITTAAPAGQTMVGSSIKIDLSNGQSALNGTAAITLTYPGTVLFPSLLQIYYLDEATGRWSRDFASTVNTSSRTVTGHTPHFSTFALMLGTEFAANLDSVQVYPVPYKPNGANADEGRPFTQGDANSGIIFANLAMGSEIRIYTLTGRQVASLDQPTIAGTVRWDARNQDGRDVASGAYFAVISAAGQKAVVKKLVIIR